MMKDTHRDMKYTGTMKCSCCEEESNLPQKFPFKLDEMVKQLEAFIKMHKIKGCNKKQVDIPDWASGEINVAISV